MENYETPKREVRWKNTGKNSPEPCNERKKFQHTVREVISNNYFTKPEEIEPKQKQVFICRGISGSGKSTLIHNLKERFRKENPDAQISICSADHYFIHDGEYKFDGSKLKEAHEQCKEKFSKDLNQEKGIIFVDNTNLEYWEMQYYVEEAERRGYEINILEVHAEFNEICSRQNNEGGKNISKEKIQHMREKLRNPQVPENRRDFLKAQTIHVNGGVNTPSF